MAECGFFSTQCKEYEKRALEFCESLYPVGQGTNGCFSVTGEPYVVLQVGFQCEVAENQWIKQEGEEESFLYGGTTPEKGLDSFKEAFSGYTANKSHGTLYWRCCISSYNYKCHALTMGYLP
ncbi:hypothetical protein LCGC14_2525490, partial [marine sediment metagenome]